MRAALPRGAHAGADLSAPAAGDPSFTRTACGACATTAAASFAAATEAENTVPCYVSVGRDRRPRHPSGDPERRTNPAARGPRRISDGNGLRARRERVLARRLREGVRGEA